MRTAEEIQHELTRLGALAQTWQEQLTRETRLPQSRALTVHLTAVFTRMAALRWVLQEGRPPSAPRRTWRCATCGTRSPKGTAHACVTRHREDPHP